MDAGGTHGRSPGPWLLTVVGTLLLLAGTVLVLRSATPLDAISPVAVANSVLQGEIPDIAGRGGIGLPYEHGGEVAYAFVVRNDGPVGITVTSVDAGVGERTLLSPYGVFVLPPGAPLDGGELEHGTAFTPFALGSGEERVIVVRGTFDNCEYFHERNLEPHASIDIGYRMLGVPGNQRVEFDRDIVVKSPMIVGCPDRTLDREDDRRTDAGS
ncbi:MAG: hypothetical protein KY469_11725 [Actinobacteria bacterium]|nr:hypothetical protein [Actinomycetota bacterium]